LGLLAHMFSILKLAKVLGVLNECSMTEWAAAKGICVWAELNIQMFGEYLAPQLISCSLPIGVQKLKSLHQIGIFNFTH